MSYDPWLRHIPLGAVAVGAFVCLVFATANANGQESLDDELFSDLVPATSAKREEQPSAARNVPNQKVASGDDATGDPTADLLGQVESSMFEVRRLLRLNRLSGKTQEIQVQIVGELDKLINDLEGKQSSQSQSNQSQQGKQQQRRQSKARRSGREQMRQANQGGNNPSENASTTPMATATQIDTPASTNTDAAIRDRMMQDAWGTLPEAAQRQMRSARPEKFVPKYSRLIEEYFKRLSKERVEP